jgi:phenol 2-monooxygenase
MFCPDLKSGHDIFAMRGIDRKAGCIVVVRPDQYVAQVLPVDAYKHLASYFNRFMLPESEGRLRAAASRGETATTLAG